MKDDPETVSNLIFISKDIRLQTIFNVVKGLEDNKLYNFYKEYALVDDLY